MAEHFLFSVLVPVYNAGDYLPDCPYEDLNPDILPVLRPSHLEGMIRVAEKLSEGFPELRVDLYEAAGRVYFGELALFSQGGFDDEITRESDLLLGSRLRLQSL